MVLTQKQSAQEIKDELKPLRAKLIDHPLYQNIHTLHQVRHFMEWHVFAVWDFMSLLKALQAKIAGTQLPWLPRNEAAIHRLINEIVLGEESDLDPQGNPTSHFELYHRAMDEAGANTVPIDRMIEELRRGANLESALKAGEVPEPVRNFVEFTFEITARNRPHELASAFTFGREEVVPALFGELVADLDRDQPGNVSLLRYYLTRHNQVEVEQHGQAALRMVNKLAGDDPDNWTAVERVAQESLNMRIELWDYINETMPAE